MGVVSAAGSAAVAVAVAVVIENDGYSRRRPNSLVTKNLLSGKLQKQYEARCCCPCPRDPVVVVVVVAFAVVALMVQTWVETSRLRSTRSTVTKDRGLRIV